MKRTHWFPVALAAVLLALGPVAVALAGEEGAEAQETTLTGLLEESEDGYALTEQDSGESVVLRGPEELAEHVGSMVNVTGKWAKDAYGYSYFEVSKVEPAAES